MTLVQENNFIKLFLSLLVPLVLVAIQYLSLVLVQALGFQSFIAFLMVGSLNLLIIFFICRHFNIILNQSSILLQIKSGVMISGLGLLSLSFAYVVVKLWGDISIWELFRGENTSDLSVSSRLIYLFTIGVFGPLYEEVYFRAFTLNILDKLVTPKPLYYYLGRSSAVFAFVIAHVLPLGFSFWNVYDSDLHCSFYCRKC